MALSAYLSRRSRANGLCVPRCRDYLSAALEAQESAPSQAFFGLHFCAALLAKSVRLFGRPVFSSGRQVRRVLSARRILALTQRLQTLCCREDLAGLAPQTAFAQLQAQLARTGMTGLQQRVLQQYRILPTDPRARDLTRGDVLFCAALLQDVPAFAQESNPSFDTKRFEELKHHG